MSKYDALFEDMNDLFAGTPSSKFWDIVNQANEEIVQDEVDKVFKRYAIMEMMLSEGKGLDYDLYADIEKYGFENSIEVENKKKGLYIEFTGDIVCRLDS